MRKDYNNIIELANDVGRKQAFMQYYGQLCSSAAASFDEHGHNNEASYYLSNDPVLFAVYDLFKGTLEAAWSSTTVDAESTSCCRCQTLFVCATTYAGSFPLCPDCQEQANGANMYTDPDYYSGSATGSDTESSDPENNPSESDEDSTYNSSSDASSSQEENSLFADVLR